MTWIACFVVSVCMAVFAGSAVAADNYLDALSDEAESTAQVPSGDGQGKVDLKALKQMELQMQDRHPSTWRFYKKLSSKNKVRVFELYVADHSDTDVRMRHLQKQVLDLYLKK